MEKETRPVRRSTQPNPKKPAVSTGARPRQRPSAKPAQSVSAQNRQTAVTPTIATRIRRARQNNVARRHAIREPKFVTVRKVKQNRKPFPLGLVMILVMITAMFLFMMMNYAEIDQYNGEIRELQKEVANLQAEQKKLDVRLENKDDRTMFDAYATEQLGMVKADTLNKQIVTLRPDDKTEMMEYDDGEDSGFGYLLSGLAEVVRDFFG